VRKTDSPLRQAIYIRAGLARIAVTMEPVGLKLIQNEENNINSLRGISPKRRCGHDKARQQQYSNTCRFQCGKFGHLHPVTPGSYGFSQKSQPQSCMMRVSQIKLNSELTTRLPLQSQRKLDMPVIMYSACNLTKWCV
jgi:hypothetical protein